MQITAVKVPLRRCLQLRCFAVFIDFVYVFLSFWTKRIHCNTNQTLWLNGRIILKTLLSPNQVEIAASISMCFTFPVSGRVFPTPVRRRYSVSLVRISTRKMIAASKAFNKLNNDLIFLPKPRPARLTQIQIKSLQQYKQNRLPIIYRYFLYFSPKFFSLLRQP